MGISPLCCTSCLSICFVVVLVVANFGIMMQGTNKFSIIDRRVKASVKYFDVPPIKNKACPNGIDAVWLWVNGSDPVFRKALEENGRKGGAGRYRDYNTLQYSIRSVYNFAPYIKNYYIVTMGQIPDFLNTSSLTFKDYKLRIVDHKEIFPNNKDLPVFNSNALEVSIHNIKNLSSCFLYLNDDMLLGKKLKPEHFCRKDGKINIYHNGWNAPEVERMKHNLWHKSVGTSNELINNKFHPKDSTYKHPYVSHHCYFFKTDTLKEMEEKWQEQYKQTRTHKFRLGNDLAIPFLHGAYSVESNKGVYVREKWYYYGLVDNNRTNNLKIINGIKKKKPQCICLNDGLDDKDETNMSNAIDRMTLFLETLIPNPSPFEKLEAN
ncbi:hypothetical protein, conserved [Entamoeba dispar SAW760]|uniref:Glycosyltransferase n=1 Tax=Entamoeba dispar (strain ATCC PRA-260 / SAW760) TaxID=370354 RepID=B0ED01_ENTDS|nr:uncharacterized protein EDI_091690 [Entamoeba dispar SAW760]EDR27418.1 hypothetical protein, conserved [Entamoeba dispar SAW760]|eukprot:EDR27418.1 hypothetical protein, conserved [Entamoeba dispar SAW760]